MTTNWLTTKPLFAIVFLLLSGYLLVMVQYSHSAPSPKLQPAAVSSFGPSYMLRQNILHQFPNYNHAVSYPAGKRVYVTNWYSVITSFDADQGVVRDSTNAVHRPEKLMLSPDGSRLFVSSHVLSSEDGRITVLDTETLSILASHVYPNPSDHLYYNNVRGMALGPYDKLYISPQGKFDGGAIDTMDLISGEIETTLPFPGFIIDLASHNDTLYATYQASYNEGALFKFDISSGIPVSVTAVAIDAAGHLAIAPNGSFLAVRSDGVIYQYNADTLEHQATYSTPETDGFAGFAFSADSQQLIALYRPNGYYESGGLKTFNLQTGALERLYTDSSGYGPTVAVGALAEQDVALVHPNGLRLLTPADHHVALPIAFNRYCSRPLIDDFSNPASGWPIDDTGAVIYRYVDGEYNIFHRHGNRWAAVTRGDVWQQSRLVEVSGQIVQHQGVWGLLYGLNDDWTDFYTFEIIPHQQRWIILHYTASAGWSLVNQGATSVIRPGTESNTLALRSYGATFVFRINDYLVASFSDLQHRTGRVGLTGGSFQSDVDIRYDNYLFVDADCPLPGMSGNNAFAGEVNMFERPPIWQLLPLDAP